MPTMVVKKNGIVYEQQLFLNTDNCVYVVADGVKTYSELLNELYALIDADRIGRNTTLVRSQPNGVVTYFHIMQKLIAGIQFSEGYAYGSNDSPVGSIILQATNSTFKVAQIVAATVTDISSNVPTSGTIISLYYNIVVSGQGMETDAQDVSYGSSNVKVALDSNATAISTNTTDIGTINTKLGKFQYGTYTTEGITKNTEMNITVPFSSAFSSVPAVVVTPVCSFGYGGYLSGHLKSVAKTQFIYNIKNTSNSDLPLLLNWMATNM